MRIALLDFILYPKKRSTLSRKAESPSARLGRRRVWSLLCVLAFTLCFTKDYSVATEHYKPKHYKQYILIQLNDFEQAYCLIELYHQESRFDPTARNGSHYGIPQGRSVYLSRVSGTKQIDWGIKYVHSRYGSACAAYKHWQVKGWH